MSFKFDPQAFNYEKAVQNSEAALQNDYWTFKEDKQTAFHVVPLSSTKIGTEIWEFTSPLVSDKLFNRSTLSMKCTPNHNWFMRDKMEELGFVHGVTNSSGELEYRQCPVKELIELTGLPDQVPMFEGKKGTIVAKEVGYYVIVPYATRNAPSSEDQDPKWVKVPVVQPYWIIAKDGKKTDPHLRPIIETLFAKSKGQVANLNGTTYLCIKRLGKGNDTKYVGEIMDLPAKTFNRQTAKEVLDIVSEKFDSLNPAVSLAFMMPARSELETLARKAGVTLTSLFPTSSNVATQETVANSFPDTGNETSTGDSVLDL